MNNVNSFFNRISNSAILRLVAVILIALTCSGSAFGQEIIEAVKDSDLAKVKALLKDNPALVSSKDSTGRTALCWAAGNGNKYIAALLLANKADVNARDVFGRTPLYIAADLDQMEVAKLLLAKKADINAGDIFGQTPLQMAVGDAFGRQEMVQLLLTNNAYVNAKDSNGFTPLHIAAGDGDKGLVTLLLANNADVNAKDKMGRTPLQLAEAKGKNDTAEVLHQYINHERWLWLLISLGVLAVAALGYVMWRRRKKRLAVRLSEPEA